jgi:DNA-binding transcriptional MerR regulator
MSTKKNNLMASRMRMKDLVSVTGVPKGTIQYYINEGLIPAPMKTQTNMAYYSDDHIDGIRLVKELQSKRYLPLSVIKQLIRQEKNGLSVDEIQTIAKLDGKLFKNLHESLTIRKINLKQLSDRTGADLKEINELEMMGILHPQKKGKQKYFDEDDIRIMECWKKLRELGFSKELGFAPEDFIAYRELMAKLVEEETKIMLKRTLGRISVDQMVQMVEEGTPVLNTIIGLIRKKLILETVKKYAAAFTDSENTKIKPEPFGSET